MSLLGMKDIGLVSKIKAIYGKRLKFEDYVNLKQMHSIAEITAYLKKHPGYGDVLKNISESSMHRKTLEILLKEELTKEYIRIINFVKGDDEKLLYCMVIHFETEEIMFFLRTLISEHQREYAPRIPPELKSRSVIDYEKLQKADTLPLAVEALKGTRYYNTLIQFVKDRFISYSKIEVALRSQYFKYIVNAVNQYVSGEDKKLLLDYVGGQIDLTNFNRIIRCKRYFGSQDNSIYSSLMPLTHKLDKNVINQMIAANTWQEAYDMIYDTSYKKLFLRTHYEMSEQYYYEFIWRMARKIMHGNHVSVSVPYAYLNIKQIEIKNLTNIVEGVRYQVEPDTIDRHLIGVGA